MCIPVIAVYFLEFSHFLLFAGKILNNSHWTAGFMEECVNVGYRVTQINKRRLDSLFKYIRRAGHQGHGNKDNECQSPTGVKHHRKDDNNLKQVSNDLNP